MSAPLKHFTVWRDPDGAYFACARGRVEMSTSTALGDVMAASASDAVQRYRLTMGDWQLFKHWVLQVQGPDRESTKSFAVLKLNGQFIDLLRLRAKQMQQASLVNPFHTGSVMAENFPPITSLKARFTAPSQSVKFDGTLEDNPGKWELAMVGGESAVRFVANTGDSTSYMPVEQFAQMFDLQTAGQVQVFGTDYPALLKSMVGALERSTVETRERSDSADRSILALAASKCSEIVFDAEESQARDTPGMAP